MVLCTAAVYLAENESFAFLDSSFLEADGWSDAILKQLELGRVCKYTRMGMGGRVGKGEIKEPDTVSYPNSQRQPHHSSYWLV